MSSSGPAPRTSAPGCAAPPSLRGSALWLGICFGICFVTGLVSHYAQEPGQPVPFPTGPSWGYRVTQGLHVAAGTAAIPLLLVKLWTVYPRLFLRPPLGGPRRLAVDGLERVSIGGAGRGGDLPAGDRAGERHPVVPLGLLLPRHPLRRRLDRHRRAGGAHRREAAGHPRGRWARDVDDATHDRRDRDRARRADPARPAAHDLAGGRRSAVLATAGSTVPLLRQVSVFARPLRRRPGGHPDQQDGRAAAGRRPPRDAGRLPARGRVRRAGRSG